MTPEQIVYDRLSLAQPLAALVEDRVYPSTPTENTQLPFAVYTVTTGDPTLTTTGPSNLTKYSVEVDAWAVDLSSVLAVLGAVKAQLNGWRGGPVQGCFWVGHSTDEQDIGHHGQATYTLWVDQAQVVPPSSPQALISTGPDSITLTACDHTLTLDCDGLTLDTNPVSPRPPRLTRLDGWTVNFEVDGTADEVAVFKYVPYRSGPHKKASWTPHQGKRWDKVFVLDPAATSWEYPTTYAGSVRPYDNYAYDANPTRNLRTSKNPRSFRVGARYGTRWLLSDEVVRYLAGSGLWGDPDKPKIGLGHTR